MNEKHHARRQLFARNLKAALQARRSTGGSPDGEAGRPTRESISQLCRRLGFDDAGYLWVRKITSKGISHVRGQRRDDLDTLCRELGIDYHTLWVEPKTPTEHSLREDVGDQRTGTEEPLVTSSSPERDLNLAPEATRPPRSSELAMEGILDGLARAIVERAKRQDQPVEDVLKEFAEFLLGKLRVSVERFNAPRTEHEKAFGEFLGEISCRLGTVQVYKVRKKSKADVRKQFENIHYLPGINPAARYYVACFEGEMIAFDSALPLVGMQVGGWREHRLIVKPQFQGMQVGSRLSDFLGEHYTSIGNRFFSKTMSLALGEYRNRSPLWRPTKTNCKPRVRREQDCYGGITYDSDRIGYNHEYVGLNPRPITVAEPKRFTVPLEKDGVIYLSKPFSLLAKKFVLKKPHIERMIAGTQTHVKGFTLVAEDLRPLAEKMLQELDQGTLKEIDILTLRSVISEG